MRDNKTNGTSGGVGFTGLLTICFIVLKLTNVINWPWLWVLSPIWIAAAIVTVLVVLAWWSDRKLWHKTTHPRRKK